MRPRVRSILSALALAAGLAGPILAAQAGAQPAYPPVPPPRAEVVPPPPGTRYVWEPGGWFWDGARYVWHGGRYVTRAAGWSHWVPAHWVMRGGAWAWVPGHWR